MYICEPLNQVIRLYLIKIYITVLIPNTNYLTIKGNVHRGYSPLFSMIFRISHDFTLSEITPDVVRHLAGLARIDVTDAEVNRFTEQLGLIVDSAATLKAAVAGDVPATSHPIPMKNIYREDVVLESLSQKAALSGSADSESGRFRVAAILDEE